MELISSLAQLHKVQVPCVIALGTFDGLHLGHQDVIKRARDYAAAHGLRLAVFTFSNHPMTLIDPQCVPVALITQEQKLRYFQKLGVDLLVNVPFDRKLAKLSPEEFLAQLEQLDFRCLVVGENFSFGYHGVGNQQTLADYAAAKGCDLLVCRLVSIGQRVISSTTIRQLIMAGKVMEVQQLLGRPYSLTGIVSKGNQRGNLLGFPTANIELQAAKVAVPLVGVYAVQAFVDEHSYQGMGNIGNNPTFGDVEQARLEVNIFDYSGNLYGRELTVAFCQRVRGEVKFQGIEQLVAQLEQDKLACRRILENL